MLIQRDAERFVKKAKAKRAMKLLEAFSGDAVDFMRSVYQDRNLPLELRLNAARSAAKFERPILAAIAALPAPDTLGEQALSERRRIARERLIAYLDGLAVPQQLEGTAIEIQGGKDKP